jgi:hypothetical protein
MADSLYDTDFVAWTEQQADLLRRQLAGERVNGLDWERILEELEDLGKSETRAVASLLTQCMVHALKVARWPTHPAVGPWLNEAVTFLAQARRRYLRSMAKDLDAAECFADARRIVLAMDHRSPPDPVPETSALSLAELLDNHADLAAAVRALSRQPAG